MLFIVLSSFYKLTLIYHDFISYYFVDFTLPCGRSFNPDPADLRGMGSALGGGAADQYLGAGSAAQLSKLTVWGILFFLCSLSVSMLCIKVTLIPAKNFQDPEMYYLVWSQLM